MTRGDEGMSRVRLLLVYLGRHVRVCYRKLKLSREKAMLSELRDCFQFHIYQLSTEHFVILILPSKFRCVSVELITKKVF